MVPTWTGKPGKWENIFQSGKSQGILNRLEKSGNCTQNTRKLREVFIYYFFFSNFLIEVYLLNRVLYLLNSFNETLKKYWKMENKTGKVREICQSENVGSMIM